MVFGESVHPRPAFVVDKQHGNDLHALQHGFSECVGGQLMSRHVTITTGTPYTGQKESCAPAQSRLERLRC